MKYLCIFLIVLIIIFFCYHYNIIENFIEYDTKNKEYISVKQNNKQFVNSEYLIDPHVRHILPQEVKHLILKEYRHMKDNEKQELRMIFEECFQDGEDFDFSKDTLILGYYIKDKLVGYVGMLTSANFVKWLAENNIWEYNAYGVIDQNGLYMYNLCVLPKYRNKGIGKELIKGVIDFSNEIRATHINLTVLNDKDIPIKLYRKYDFIQFFESLNSANGKVITMVKYINK